MAASLKYLSRMARPYHMDDRRYKTPEIKAVVACASRSVYVGNLSFYTTEDQIYELFGAVGPIDRVIMGLNRVSHVPCGFCFVIFADRQSVITAMTCLNGVILDGRVIKIEIDKGFIEGRQYGRGDAGGQVRDEFREEYDEGRGGAAPATTPQKAVPAIPFGPGPSPRSGMAPPPPPGMYPPMMSPGAPIMRAAGYGGPAPSPGWYGGGGYQPRGPPMRGPYQQYDRDDRGFKRDRDFRDRDRDRDRSPDRERGRRRRGDSE